MKKFNAPEIEIEKFAIMDIITTSPVVCDDDCYDDDFVCDTQF